MRAICKRCGESFEWQACDDFIIADFTPAQCDACNRIDQERDAAARKERIRQKAAAEAMDIVKQKTPARYAATDIAHPQFNLRLWQRIKSWMPTDTTPWLGMVGPTGTSKTRCAYLLASTVAAGLCRHDGGLANGPFVPSFQALEAYKLADLVAAKAGDKDQARKANEMLAEIRRAHILLLDDLGKHRNTPAVHAELFAMMDHRHASNLCTIWTANSAPETVVASMPEDMAAPLAGRIRECSHIIILK